MIPKDAVLPALHQSVKPWHSLTDEEKKIECRKMELYAGMVDNLDHNIGRLIQHLKDIGEYDNTLIIFMSDNGAAAEDFYNSANFGPFIREHYNNDYANMGRPGSYVSYGAAWAEAGSSPFRYFKSFTTEGGLNAPMIMAGPQVKRTNEIADVFVTLVDIAPTLYEVAGVQYPATFEGHAIYPLKGSSMIPFVSNKTQQVHDSNYVFGLEHDHYAMIRKGDWKISSELKPFNEANFKLYHLSKDLAENHDLKDAAPKKYQEMIGEWRKFAKEIKAQLSGEKPAD